MSILRCFYGIALLAIMLALAACGDSKNTKNDKPEPTFSPVLLSNLQQKYDALRESQQAIVQVWENLATGQQARCGEYPEVINPVTLDAGGDLSLEPLAELLHGAALNINQAVNLWKAECLKPRTNPAPDVIDQGRLAARAAGDALNEAEALLTSLKK